MNRPYFLHSYFIVFTGVGQTIKLDKRGQKRQCPKRNSKKPRMTCRLLWSNWKTRKNSTERRRRNTRKRSPPSKDASKNLKVCSIFCTVYCPRYWSHLSESISELCTGIMFVMIWRGLVSDYHYISMLRLYFRLLTGARKGRENVSRNRMRGKGVNIVKKSKVLKFGVV